MATRALTTLLRCGTQKLQTRSVYTIHNKIGTREVLAHGINGEPVYIDCVDFPCPAIRYKEVTPDIQVKKIQSFSQH